MISKTVPLHRKKLPPYTSKPQMMQCKRLTDVFWNKEHKNDIVIGTVINSNDNKQGSFITAVLSAASAVAKLIRLTGADIWQIVLNC